MNTQPLFRAAAAAGCLMLASTLAAELPPEVEKLVAAAEATQRQLESVSYSFKQTNLPEAFAEEIHAPARKDTYEGRVEHHAGWTLIQATYTRRSVQDGALDSVAEYRCIRSADCFAWGEFPGSAPPEPYRIATGGDAGDDRRVPMSLRWLPTISIDTASFLQYFAIGGPREMLESYVAQGCTFATSAPDDRGLVHVTVTSTAGSPTMDATFDTARGCVVPEQVYYRKDGAPLWQIDRTFESWNGAWFLSTLDSVQYSTKSPKGQQIPYIWDRTEFTPLSLGDTAPVEPFQWLCEGRDVMFTVVDAKNQPIGQAPCHDGRIRIDGVEYP